MSRLLSPFYAAPTLLATISTALFVGAGGAAVTLVSSGVALASPRVPVLALAFTLAAAAVVIVGSGWIWGSRAALATHLRVGFVSSALLSWHILDTLHIRLFLRHLDESALSLGWEAVRSGTLRVDVGGVLFSLGAVCVLAMLIALAHALLSRIPCSARLEAAYPRWAAALVLGGLCASVLRERLWDERHPDALRFARALPWAPDASQVEEARSEVDRGPGQDARTLVTLRMLRSQLEQAALTATVRPNLLIVHIESLRHDVFTPELMPQLTALGAECLVGRHHYSTGNNTGSSVFGLVSGLPGFFYSGARQNRAPALPLVVLQRLGYRNSVHFANNLATYDDVFDVVFKGAIDEVFIAPDGPSDKMDVAVVDHYLSTLGREGQRFDYLVLDSTHYDYAYPPEFERHTPSGTLGFGIRDGVIDEPGINERMKPRAPLVKNRYLNSVEWVDTLLGRVVAGLRTAGLWDKTWVAIVGDHGEAFWEHGGFGHGTGLEDEQIRVPLVLCGPSGHPPSRYEYSSHADIMPTWFDRMGVTGEPGPFMSGRSLDHYHPEADLAVTGKGVHANYKGRTYMVAGRGIKVTFSNTPTLPLVAVFDANDQPLKPIPDDAWLLLTQMMTTKVLRSPGWK